MKENMTLFNVLWLRWWLVREIYQIRVPRGV